MEIMQTFLPYPDMCMSVECLDTKRLGKQRVEAAQIYRAITTGQGGWIHHPAVKMWQGHHNALAYYHDRAIIEWVGRGYKNTMKLLLDYEDPDRVHHIVQSNLPPWFGDTDFHLSHQSNLLRKDPTFYGIYGWTVPANLPYIWPVR